MGNDGFYFIERVLGCNIHISDHPAHAFEFAATNVRSALFQMAKSRMLQHHGFNVRWINTSDEQPTIQQRLARAARRAANFDTFVARSKWKTAPLNHLFQLGVRPRDSMRWQADRNRAAGPSLSSLYRSVIADPPLARFDDHYIQHTAVARRSLAMHRHLSR